ncbi:MAG: hypothetical protein ACSLE6_17625 [Mycobacterium sp.]
MTGSASSEPVHAHHAGATALLRAQLPEYFGSSVVTLAAVYTGTALAEPTRLE